MAAAPPGPDGKATHDSVEPGIGASYIRRRASARPCERGSHDLAASPNCQRAGFLYELSGAQPLAAQPGAAVSIPHHNPLVAGGGGCPATGRAHNRSCVAPEKQALLDGRMVL